MPQTRRGQWVIYWLIGSLILAGIAFGAGSLVTSPWQAAVENSKETLISPITLADQSFHSEIPTIQGSLSLGDQMSVLAPANITHVVITDAILTAGDSVSNGEVLIGISGRPLFALHLAIPMYRDLEPGMTGPDVESLQVALGKLGLYRGIADGDYGRGTANAVKSLYKQARYEPPPSLTKTNEHATTSNDEPATEPDGGQEAEKPSENLPSSEKITVVDLGTTLPMAEVMDLPEGEVTIISSLKLGTAAEPAAEVVTLRTGRARVVARVGVSAADHFKAGQSVLVAFPASGQEPVEVPVSEVSDFLPGSADGVTPGYNVVADLDASHVADLTDELLVSVTPAGQPESKTALGVPLTALHEDSDGIYVLLNSDTPTRVPVTLGLRSNGYAEVLDGQGLTVGTSILLDNTHG